MWNPEARDSSPIIFYINEFMGENQNAAAAREEGDKTELVEGSRARMDWMSWIWNRGSRGGAITPVKSPLPHSTGREGTRCRRRADWKEGNKGYPSDQIHCGGGARSVLGEYAKLRRLP